MEIDEIKKEALRNIEEFDMAWNEFFKDKSEPKNDNEDRKQQEDFHHWYNYVRKQSDTGKTPAEMYIETQGEEAGKHPKEPNRIMNFEWDDVKGDNAWNNFEGEDEDDGNDTDEKDEEELKEITEIADAMFNESVWQNSKEQLKDLSKRESSQHMFRLGFFMHSEFMKEQLKHLHHKFKDFSPEELRKMIDDIGDDDTKEEGENENETRK